MLNKSFFEKRTRPESVVVQIEPLAEKKQDFRENLIEIRANLIKTREAEAQDLLDSVQHFKIESFERYNYNEKLMAAYREMIPSAKYELIDKYYARIDELELKNDEIKNKVNSFTFEGKCKWISFKNEYKHDIGYLERALKEFAIEK